MRIPALTTLLLALTTSVVAAAPDRTTAPPAHESVAPTREETTGRLSYNDAAPKPAADAAVPDGWIELASATPASHGREFITVDAEAGALTRLRLSAAAGRPSIQAVRVDYVHGGSRTFPIAKTLVARRAPTYVDLRGAREIRQIIVISDRDSRGSYVVQGLASDAGVAMR